MFFYSYIQEIKIRLIYVVLSFLITFLSLYIYSNILLEFLINNLLSIKNNSLIFTTITESFMSHIRFSINFSIIISLFVFFVQLWLFLKPGLYYYENFYVKLICFIFIVGFIFSNYIVLKYLLPIFFNFFLSFENLDSSKDISYIVYQGRISEYLSFVYNILFNIGILFQFPLLMIID